jgi:phospholipid/cholesterol/gamma-HCH transport system substrate-binding protein
MKARVEIAETKVGLLVIVALAALGLVLWYFIGIVAARAGYPLYVQFERADVSSGDPVMIAGVPIGHVESVDLTRDNKARVLLRINRGVELHKGYAVRITPGSLLGQAYVEFTPTPRAQAGPVLEPGARITGQPYVRLEDVVGRAQGLLIALTKTVQSLNATVSNEQLQKALRQSLTSVAQASKELGQLTAQLRGMAVESRPQLRQMLTNLAAVSHDVRASSEIIAKDLKQTEIPARLEETSARLLDAMEKMDEVVAQVHQMATDPETRQLVQSAGQNLSDATASLRQASEQINATAANARDTMASIDQASKDAPTISANMREATANIRDASADIKEMTREARPKVAKVIESAAAAAQAVRTLPKIKTALDVGAQYRAHQGRWWIDANVDLASGERGLRLGLADLGETNRINAQLGQRLGPGMLRYGVVQSQVGLGYDWLATPWLTVTGEIFDPNDPRGNAFGYVGLGPGLDGLDAVVGYRDIGRSEGSPVVGMRVRR